MEFHLVLFDVRRRDKVRVLRVVMTHADGGAVVTSHLVLKYICWGLRVPFPDSFEWDRSYGWVLIRESNFASKFSYRRTCHSRNIFRTSDKTPPGPVTSLGGLLTQTNARTVAG